MLNAFRTQPMQMASVRDSFTAPIMQRNALAAMQSGQGQQPRNAFTLNGTMQGVPPQGGSGGSVTESLTGMPDDFTLGASPNADGDSPAAIDIAGSALGLNEHDKSAALQEFLANGGQNLDPAVTAWCAAFVNATLAQAGGEGTGRLNARSFLDWGNPVDEPMRGDVAVFSRGDPNGWQGHVGFFDGYADDGSIRVLGGNQSDAVNIQNYPASRLLGFRRM